MGRATRPHKFAIIGLGIMGRRLLAQMLRHPAYEPVALWDPSPIACEKARTAATGIAIASSAEAAMAAADAVYLACPPKVRKAYALAAAKAGKPIFLEKPLGIDVGESQDLVARLEHAAVPAAVNFTQAASPALAEIKRAIDAGETGPIQGIDIIVTYANWPRAWQIEADWLRFREEGGFTREVISHFIFVSERLLGRLKLVWAGAHYQDNPELCESHLLARLETATGTPVSLFGSVGGAQADRQEVTVKGSRRSYRILDFYQLQASDGGSFVEALKHSDDPRTEALQAQLTELDKCISGASHELATLQDALSVQELVENILSHPI